MVPELSVTDFEASFTFYTNILGFGVIHARKNPDFAYLDQGGVQIMIEQYDADSWNTGPLEPPLGRGVNFQIELIDISTVYNRLRENRFPLFMDIVENWYQVNGVEMGQKEFLVQDPDGYLLRFCESIEGAKPKGDEGTIADSKS